VRIFRQMLVLLLALAVGPTLFFAWLSSAVSPEVGWILLGATAIAAAFLAGLAARNVVQPVQAVVEGALEIARGNFGAQVAIVARNELGDLAHTFNYMSRQLRLYDAQNRELIESLERGYMETITALANAVDSKDPYTRGHSMRVAELARATGEELGLSPADLRSLTYGGILHDVGKIGIPEAILLKQSRLSPEEMKVMRTHPEIGATIVGGVQFLAGALPCVRNHHERWDGRGYPDGLAADRIPLVARIVNCADTYDAITSTRPYQAAATADRALEIMEALRGAQIDGAVLDAFTRVIHGRRARGISVSELDGGDPYRQASGS
jgi:putative nucleotidyltransferase with HDIG domain